MKITKYPQSCIMIESNGNRILVDPGVIKFKDEYTELWNNVDFVLITHKHPDHCNNEFLINFDKPIYSTLEVSNAYKDLEIDIIKEGATFGLFGFNITVTKAIHGYQPMLKGDKEIHENVGYIINDGKTSVYVTSDTICFRNDYKADVICMPVTGHGLTMSAFEATLYAKEVEAKTVILVHMDNPAYPPDLNYIGDTFAKHNVPFLILENDTSIEV